jgi:NADPH-dependent curcumin reductase CurA
MRDDDFSVIRQLIPELEPGQLLIHNRVTSVDPYQIRMLRGVGGHADQEIGDVIHAGCVGLVVASRDPRAPIGTQVATYSGWTEYASWRLDETEIADPDFGDELDWIHILGTPGVTAFIGLNDVGGLAPGITVAVSAAAGAIGGAAVQIAKVAGARVIAIAGGPERVAHTTEVLGADVGLDYKVSGFEANLAAAAGDGIDLYFDNVGGPLLQNVIGLLAPQGTAVVCGAVSSYGSETAFEVKLGLTRVLEKRLSIRGFRVGDYYASRLLPVRAELSAMLKAGVVTNVISEFSGLASAPDALQTVYRTGTAYVGKRVVRIA